MLAVFTVSLLSGWVTLTLSTGSGLEGQREQVLSPGRAPRVDGRLRSLLSLGLRSGDPHPLSGSGIRG